MGRRCDTCRESTFGLLYVGGQSQHHRQQVVEQETYAEDGGCTSCFCFGRSSSCVQAQLVWSQVIPSLVIRSSPIMSSHPPSFCQIRTHHSQGKKRMKGEYHVTKGPTVIECPTFGPSSFFCSGFLFGFIKKERERQRARERE